MIRYAIPVVSLIGAILILNGCTAPAPQVVTRVQVERVTIPAPLLAAPDLPTPPTVNRSDNVAGWIARLWADDLNKTDQLRAIGKLQVP